MTIDVETLSVQCTDVKPIDIDWQRALGYDEDGEARCSFWEAFDYELDDDREFRLIASNGTVVAVVDDDVYTSWEDYEENVITDHFEETGDIPEGALTEEEFQSLMEVEPSYHGSEGPMMNYWYPIHESRLTGPSYGGGFHGKDPIALANAIYDLPLCIVEVDDNLGLALTGGGMDLSWPICRAFIRLGMLPPAHFADLPAYADEWGEGHEDVYAAMRRSLEFRIQQHQYRLERLDDLKTRMTERGNR